ncbi:HEAT repeat domain-containing protein [Herbiconiux sp. SYSU D00978]|uniref:HEAT repeat domain-containing protein n=1 Tax=Herbiconiux sp. SYSU D00978 TaxID=2812562 RepID=UPI001A963B61|nr:HEAT repeat domain-containing protein [Herbiconiux sp. SYSU D00978]
MTASFDPRTWLALEHPDSSVRLRAALALGTRADDSFADTLIERSGVEPDFFVRDMLTWALTRLPATATVPRLIARLASDVPQVQSQALHTLSKIGDPAAWHAITPELLTSPHDEVARTAWRAGVVLAPEAERGRLAEILATQLARGDHRLQLSLSRALLALGDAATPVLERAKRDRAEGVRRHALLTERLMIDPEAGFEPDVKDVARLMALGDGGDD